MPPGGPSPARARNAALINQFATPGLGSLLAYRWVAGAGQLTLALVGFGLFIAWFLRTMRDYYGLMFDAHAEPRADYTLVKWGVAIFAVAWCWSLVTSVQLLLTAKTPLPPPIPK
jgi:multisubunit Na+/H+ antiporter MnhE subunit